MKRNAKNRVNLNEKAYEFLLGRLTRGELKPGQKLSEPTLAAACGVSRTPMREAVRRLVEEGVLSQVAKSGTYVTGFGAHEIADAYEIRTAIETALLARSVPNLTAADLSALRTCCERMRRAIDAMRKADMEVMTGKPEAEFLENDIAFHLRLLRASGNALAEKIIVNTYRRNQFFGTHSHQRTLSHVATAWRLHCEILKACRRRDTSAAVKWMKEHIACSSKNALVPLSEFA